MALCIADGSPSPQQRDDIPAVISQRIAEECRHRYVQSGRDGMEERSVEVRAVAHTARYGGERAEVSGWIQNSLLHQPTYALPSGTAKRILSSAACPTSPTSVGVKIEVATNAPPLCFTRGIRWIACKITYISPRPEADPSPSAPRCRFGVPNHLIRKLEHFVPLSEQSKEALQQLTHTLHLIEPGTDIIRKGDEPKYINLILTGWACRYTQLADSRRQIMSLFVPGDVCDTHAFLLAKMDHSIGTLTGVRLAQVHCDVFLDLLNKHPQIARALSCDRLVQVAVQREAIVSLGRRSGEERIAHLLCEIFLRLHAVGLTDGDTCPMPLSQVELASALGQSTVHINRTLQALRASGLIILKGKRLTIPNFDALQKVALFSPSYLHLDHKRNATA